jgi:hypothetical protein
MSVLSMDKTIVNHHHMKTTSTRQSLDATLRSGTIETNQTRLDTVIFFHIDRNKSPTSSGLEDSISIDYREALLSCSSRGHAENRVVKQRADSEYARLSRPNSQYNNAELPETCNRERNRRFYGNDSHSNCRCRRSRDPSVLVGLYV